MLIVPPAFLAFAAILLSSLASAAPARELVVGEVVDYSGKFGEATRDYVAGAKVYFDLVNTRGGVNGMRIRHVVLDGGSTAPAVRKLTRTLLDENHADVLFGYVGDEAVTAAAAERELAGAGVALVGPLAGRPAPAFASPSIFFTRPGYEAEARQIVGHFHALQVTRFTIVTTRSEADLAVAEEVKRELVRQGLVATGSHTLADAIDSPDVEAVIQLHPQAVIVVADTVPAAEFVKRYRPRDTGALIVALSTVNHRAMFEILGPKLAHGLMITQVVPNPTLAESALQKEHLDAIHKFRDEPPSHLTLEGFIAAKVLVEAMLRAGAAPTRESILASMQRMGRLDLKGMVVDLTPAGRLASSRVELTMVRRNGELLQ
jgi:branched-chain amino acid transport system substrate-binding protein